MRASEVDETDGLDQEKALPAEIRLEINREQSSLSVGGLALSFDDWFGAKLPSLPRALKTLTWGAT